MKTNIFTVAFLVFAVVSAYSSGKLEMELVNTQEISLYQKNVINILYKDENISLLKGTSGTLIIKEYMTEGKNEYYALINNSGNTVTIEIGRRPFRPFFNLFKARVEVYLPESYMNAVNIKTTDGKIDVPDKLIGLNFIFETKDGNITVNTITADMISLKSKDGNIRCEYINGNVSVESSDGKIELTLAGSVNAKTSDGNIRCTVINNVGNISLITRDGKVQLDLPKDLMFRFSARTRDGRLSTPFADRLYSPKNDRRLVEGVIGGDNISENSTRINITTGDGSINVNWLN
jgi:DUF4097 and DUF4098 domain-containing protein YvlB